MTHDIPAATARPRWQVLRWSLLALAPYWALFVAQYVRNLNHEFQATGFICYDLGYYVANGREIFERGNGLGYCNPYDTAPDSPVIYYHWLPWIFGVGISVLRFDPGAWFLVVGLLAGTAFAFGTFRLVEAILPAPRFLPGLYLLVMWGGGLCTLMAVVSNCLSGEPFGHQLLRYDPFDGWWFLSWGRNVVFTTEAVYHAIVVWAWLGVVTGRNWQAVGCIAAIAATHPFSAAQHLAILGLWLTLRLATDRRFLGPWLATGGVAATFIGYYFVFLLQFATHRTIFAAWSLAWIVPWGTFFAAYSPVAALAVARCWLDRHRWRPEMTFFVVAAAVSLLLIKHDLFVPPKQPLHFTRGYVWMPLMMLGLPLVQRMLARVSDELPRLAAALLITACSVVWVLDDAVWLATMCRSGGYEVRSTAAIFDIFRQLDDRRERGVGLVLSGEAHEDNFLLGTYTMLDPFIGHIYLCPDRELKIERASRWLTDGDEHPSLRAIDVVILAKRRPYPIDFSGWTVVCENEGLVALRRPMASGGGGAAASR